MIKVQKEIKEFDKYGIAFFLKPEIIIYASYKKKLRESGAYWHKLKCKNYFMTFTSEACKPF